MPQRLHHFDFSQDVLLLFRRLLVADDLRGVSAYFYDVELSIELGLGLEGSAEVALAYLLQHPVGMMSLLLVLLIPSQVVASLLHNDYY